MKYRLPAVLFVVQAIGRIVTQQVINGSLPLTGRFALELLLVTAVQTLALVGLENLVRLAFREPGPARPLPLVLSWPILALAYATVMVGYDLIKNNHLDLTFASYVQTIVVPTLQAVSLACLSAGSWKSWVRDLLGVFSRQRFLIVVTIADIVVLWLAAGRGVDYEAGSFPVGGLPAYYIGVKALTAGFLTLVCAWRHPVDRLERSLIALLGIGLVGHGWDRVFRWVAPLPAILFPDWPLLFQWILFYGPLFVAIVLLVTRVSDSWSSNHAGAADWLRVALGFLLFGTLVVALDIYNRPVLPLFWAKVVWIAGFLCVSAIWIAVWDFSDTSPAVSADTCATSRS